MMTEAVRNAPSAVSRCDGPCQRVGDLSEAHALAGLVTAVAHALLCHDIPRVTGFVETDLRQVISPARLLSHVFSFYLSVSADTSTLKHSVECWNQLSVLLFCHKVVNSLLSIVFVSLMVMLVSVPVFSHYDTRINLFPFYTCYFIISLPIFCKLKQKCFCCAT